MKIIVIGAGLSGLTAALTLARAGHQVDIFEQDEKPGGVTQGCDASGFHWDYGQLSVEGFGKNEPAGLILDELGVLNKIALVTENREYIFPDFEIRIPEVYAGVQWRLNLLKKLFPEETAGLDAYWKDNLRFTRLVTRARRMETGGLPAKIAFYLSLLPLLPKKDWTAERLMAHYFKSEKLKGVFTSILADFFTPPSEFMGLGVFALNAEVAFEKRMPTTLAKNAEMLRSYTIVGGMKTLVNAFVEQIRGHGGRLHTSLAIQKIVVKEGRVTGVVDAKGTTHECERLIASGGVKETLVNLVDKEQLPTGLAEKAAAVPLMGSVFMVHAGVDYDPSETLRTACTYFYGSYDIEGEVQRARKGIYHEGAVGFVVHFPSLRSPNAAPKGKHALTIYTICPDEHADIDWEAEKEAYADKLMAYAEKQLPGLNKHVVVRKIVTPLEFRKMTQLEHHAFGGIAPVMNSVKMPHKTDLEGVWFVGAQSESGGGVNNVISSAYKTAKRVACGE
jgi:phytoene desaturase